MDDAHLEADRIFGPCNDPACPGSRLRAVPDPDENLLASRAADLELDGLELAARVVQLVVVDPADCASPVVRNAAEQVASLGMSKPLPADATWSDYVNAHGGPDKPGWWVTLCWFDDQEPKPEAFGPYPTHQQAISAMQGSCLIDGIAEDTKNPLWLDDVWVAPEPASIAQTRLAYNDRVTVIDPGNPGHYGYEESDPAPLPEGTALQAAALRAVQQPSCDHDAESREPNTGPSLTL